MSLLLVVRPGAPGRVLASSSDARSPSSVLEASIRKFPGKTTKWPLSKKLRTKSSEGGNCMVLKNTPGPNARSSKARTKS